jgi:hypothetical protein
MLGLSRTTSFLLGMSNFFWMISVPSLILLSKRSLAYSTAKFSVRGLRTGMRGPPISRATENRFLIARRKTLQGSEEVQKSSGLSIVDQFRLNVETIMANLLEKVDPGEVKGTKLRILKYPNPKVQRLSLCECL